MAAPAPAERGAPATAREPWRAQAFGIEIEASFDAPGLPRATGPPLGPVTRLDLVPAEEIDRDWPATGTERLLEEYFGEGEPARTIDAHPELGYRLYARHFGLARISPKGDHVTCAPPEDEPWSWQRFLVGRILPWASVLRGREVFHASAVAFGGRAVAFVGDTGAGKTSLAVQLVVLGTEFLTDDVLAIENTPDGLVAHPGAAIVSIRPAERETIPPETWARLGTELGHSGKSYVSLVRCDRPLPLGAIYFLSGDGGPPIEPVARPDPRVLLASTFVTSVRTPARLINQLDVCAAVARDVPLFNLRIEPGVGARDLAARVHEHLEGLWPG